MSQLAERVLLSRSGITRLVDRLEKDGLLERVACPNDRRALYARLTDKGLALRKSAWPAYQNVVCEIFAEKITEEEARVMSGALLKTMEDQPECIFHGMPSCGE
jgi:DNA-binding MarR family transcriptional regulator